MHVFSNINEIEKNLKILGINFDIFKQDRLEDIKNDLSKAYKEVIKKWHPDKNPDNQQANDESIKINAAKDFFDNFDIKKIELVKNMLFPPKLESYNLNIISLNKKEKQQFTNPDYKEKYEKFLFDGFDVNLIGKYENKFANLVGQARNEGIEINPFYCASLYEFLVSEKGVTENLDDHLLQIIKQIKNIIIGTNNKIENTNQRSKRSAIKVGYEIIKEVIKVLWVKPDLYNFFIAMPPYYYESTLFNKTNIVAIIECFSKNEVSKIEINYLKDFLLLFNKNTRRETIDALNGIQKQLGVLFRRELEEIKKGKYASPQPRDISSTSNFNASFANIERNFESLKDANAHKAKEDLSKTSSPVSSKSTKQVPPVDSSLPKHEKKPATMPFKVDDEFNGNQQASLSLKEYEFEKFKEKSIKPYLECKDEWRRWDSENKVEHNPFFYVGFIELMQIHNGDLKRSKNHYNQAKINIELKKLIDQLSNVRKGVEAKNFQTTKGYEGRFKKRYDILEAVAGLKWTHPELFEIMCNLNPLFYETQIFTAERIRKISLHFLGNKNKGLEYLCLYFNNKILDPVTASVKLNQANIHEFSNVRIDETLQQISQGKLDFSIKDNATFTSIHQGNFSQTNAAPNVPYSNFTGYPPVQPQVNPHINSRETFVPQQKNEQQASYTYNFVGSQVTWEQMDQAFINSLLWEQNQGRNQQHSDWDYFMQQTTMPNYTTSPINNSNVVFSQVPLNSSFINSAAPQTTATQQNLHYGQGRSPASMWANNSTQNLSGLKRRQEASFPTDEESRPKIIKQEPQTKESPSINWQFGKK